MAKFIIRNIAKAPVARGYRAHILLVGENIQTMEQAETLVYVKHRRADGFYCEVVEVPESAYAVLDAEYVAAQREGYATDPKDWNTVTLGGWGKDF